VKEDMKRTRLLVVWEVVWIFCFGACFVAGGDLHSTILTVAEKGSKATVGIYCKRGAYENYFGTGAVISPDGYILTSTTVVPAGAEDIRVFFTDHTWKPGRIVEINEAVESTLLKVEAENLACFPLAAGLPEIGEPASSFGNANNMIRLGESAAFSAGVISGIYHVKRSERQSSYEGLAIESDAAINPGQDGGPLCNIRGELVGIISLSFSPLRWQGVAVPIDRIRDGLKTLAGGTVPLCRKSLVTHVPAKAVSLSKRFHHVIRAIVPLKVTRKYPPEKLPFSSWSLFLEGLKGKPEQEARRRVRAFLTVDRLLVANGQLRRPAGPVTGLIVSPDGYILTSLFNVGEDVVFLHKKKGLICYTLGEDYRRSLFPYPPQAYRRERNPVVSITAVLPGGKEVPARVVAKHVPLGIALLKVEAEGLPWVDVERAETPSGGERVMVLGVAPQGGSGGGHSFTMNTGVVSTAVRRMGYMFQFDAILNYGNSGGPVLGRNGVFLGLAGAPLSSPPIMGRILSSNELFRWQVSLNSGVSMGARADRIREALPRLKRGESVTSIGGAFLGVMQDSRTALSDTVRIGRVLRNSAAAKAGLKRGDVVTHLDGTQLKSWKHFIQLLQEHAPGDEVTLTVVRNKKEMKVKVTLGERQ